MWKQLLPGLRMTVLMTILTGLIYPGVVTGLCQMLFPRQANGSLIARNGTIVGSYWIGQKFERPEYFHGRPSSAGADGYDSSASGGSNLGPTSKELANRVKASIDKLAADNPSHRGTWPSDLATASASGLDPDLSPASVALQIDRVAEARRVSVGEVRRLVNRMTEGRDLGFIGELRINVLQLNLALDDSFPLKKAALVR